MKNRLTVLFLLFVSVGFAQNYPLPGATWYYNSLSLPWILDYGEKWELVDRDSSGIGELLTIQVTRKSVNPAFGNEFVVNTDEYDIQFFKTANQIFYLEDSLLPPIDFTLQTGDSVLSPFHNLNNVQNLASSCEDSLYIFQKAVVISSGLDTADGLIFRYYVIAYENFDLGTAQKRYDERSWITSEFFGMPSYGNCSGILDNVHPNFLCFYDSASSAVCPEQELWFNAMQINEEQTASMFTVFPNPFSESLNIRSDKGENSTISLCDLQGRVILGPIETSTGITNIATGFLASGYYIAQITRPNGIVYSYKLIKTAKE